MQTPDIPPSLSTAIVTLRGMVSDGGNSENFWDTDTDDKDVDPEHTCHEDTEESTGSEFESVIKPTSAWLPPSIREAYTALEDLCSLLKTSKCNAKGSQSENLPVTLTERLHHMSRFLWAYVDVNCLSNPVGGHWSKAADQTACAICFGENNATYLSHKLWKWAKAYIND
ncbi:hypothetical protein EDD16DRAFT_1528707 [Pisolithus croceorrhizus]|nr:hypothetical protein EDD16DRAFT_1528707 [Pisolithus croceorrhizus]KAI6097014.1 hypothetical protein EV401DRAFT_1895608 [Pisolithus croceorrhizus]KAI6149065.1 hypothetical protein EDD17DRAFT_1513937 [Pisolithus thermaeus]